MPSMEQTISSDQDTALVWEHKNEKGSKQKSMVANSSIGDYAITWNTSDRAPVYDLFFQGDFLISDTAIKELYGEAENHYNGKVLFAGYSKK